MAEIPHRRRNVRIYRSRNMVCMDDPREEGFPTTQSPGTFAPSAQYRPARPPRRSEDPTVPFNPHRPESWAWIG